MKCTMWRGLRAVGSVWALTALLLAGCGGGGGGGDDDGGGTGPTTFRVSASVTGNGSIATASRNIDCGTVCTADVAAGTQITLTATPAAGQQLQSWGGACSAATGTSCTVTIDRDTTVSATFVAAGGGGGGNLALAVAVTGSGRVTSQPAGIDCGTTCNASFAPSTSVTLTAAPAQGQVLQGWGGACSGAQATCTVVMSVARNVTATFAAAAGVGRAWGTAALLESSNDFNVASTNPFADVNVLTAIDQGGNALVLWQQSDGQPDGSTQKVFSRRYVAGQGWSPPVAVPGLTTTSSSVNFITGRLLLDSAGNATWIRANFETRRFSPASGWSTAVFAPANSAGGSLADAVVGADGTVHILGVGGTVLYSRLAAGGNTWTAWADVNQSALDARRPQLALGAQGSVIAVWRERNPGDNNYSVKANRSVGGAWQAPVRIEEVLTNVNDAPLRLASDAAGNAVAAWHQGNSIYVGRFSGATNTWNTPVELDAGQISTTFAPRIQLAMAADGRAVLTWNATFAMRSASITASGSVSSPVEVSSYNSGSFLGIDGNGRAVVTYLSPSQWPNPTDSTQNLYARELPWGGSWSAAALLETGAGDVKDEPFCAMNAHGEAACAWAQDDLANDTVRNSLWAAVRR